MLLKIRTEIPLTVIVLLLSMAGDSFAQASSTNKAGCSLLDKNLPSQLISYKQTDREAATVTLRLHNNTSCAIDVETDDSYPTRLVKTSKGQMNLQTVVGSQDGVRLPLHYLIQDRRKGKAPEPAYGWGDSVFTYEVLAGQSILFVVPLFHFEKGFDIAVPFNYSWEDRRSIGMGVGGVVHRVYFMGEDLPKAMVRTRR